MTPSDRLDEWMHLVIGGEDIDRAAHRLDCDVATIRKYARRLNRDDVRHTITAARRRASGREWTTPKEVAA